jgi:hypothetical protein
MRIWHQSFIVLEDVPAYTDRVRQHIDRVKADADEHRRTVHWDPSAHAPARESTFCDLPRKNFDQAFRVPVVAEPAHRPAALRT